jgi:endonuclease/exonuclease/phosphatase (EEP) superfamily protein YafD
MYRFCRRLTFACEEIGLKVCMFIPPLVRIDYIWHSAGLRALQAWQGPAIGSDHLPLQALLEFTPPRQPS